MSDAAALADSGHLRMSPGGNRPGWMPPGGARQAI